MRRPTFAERLYGAAVSLSILTVLLTYKVIDPKELAAWAGLVIAIWGFSTWTPPKKNEPTKELNDPDS